MFCMQETVPDSCLRNQQFQMLIELAKHSYDLNTILTNALLFVFEFHFRNYIGLDLALQLIAALKSL